MATEKAVIRFRCYKCNKLLGTSPARAGKTTTCPNCKADLIVPEPEDSGKAALAEATRILVPDLDDAPRPAERGLEAADVASSRHDPTFSWEELDASIFQTPGGPAPIDLAISVAPPEAPPAEPEPSADPEPTAPPEPSPPPPVVEAPAAPAPAPAPQITVDVAPVVVDRPRRRRPDEVILTQSIITSWALFMLLALAISFVAGLFVGHFVWKGP